MSGETTTDRNEADDSVWTWGLSEFRDRTASDAPTPGGGSASMVAAAVGMGLVLMALKVSARRPDAAEGLAPMIDSGEGLLRELTEHADADIAVFEVYMAALKLPRGSDEEKEVRRAALADAAMAATETPLNAAQSTLECLDLARQAAHAAHTNIVSDVAAGAALLHGALTGVLYNVDINLKSIKDAAASADYRISRNHLREAAAGRHRDIVATIGERLG